MLGYVRLENNANTGATRGRSYSHRRSHRLCADGFLLFYRRDILKKIAYSQIGSRLESAGIVEPEVIRNALTTSRTMGRPMISLLMRNVQRYNDEEMETDAKRAISEILEIPLFTNPGDCTVDQSLTKLIGLNKIEK